MEGLSSSGRGAEAATNAAAQPTPSPVAKQESQPVATASAFDHSTFNTLLNTYVDGAGNVNYSGLKANAVELDAYLAMLAATAPDGSWSRNEKLAYYINAYNAATLKLIVDNYPLGSITDLDGGKPWDVKRVNLGGQMYSLDALENQVIRPNFSEPRIHFAVNCAAASCPPLRNEAFTADKLESQLNQQTKKFLNNDAYTQVSGGSVRVSKIFDWYGEDFDNVAAYISKYRSDVKPSTDVDFMEYDWTLNKQ